MKKRNRLAYVPTTDGCGKQVNTQPQIQIHQSKIAIPEEIQESLRNLDKQVVSLKLGLADTELQMDLLTEAAAQLIAQIRQLIQEQINLARKVITDTGLNPDDGWNVDLDKMTLVRK